MKRKEKSVIIAIAVLVSVLACTWFFTKEDKKLGTKEEAQLPKASEEAMVKVEPSPTVTVEPKETTTILPTAVPSAEVVEPVYIYPVGQVIDEKEIVFGELPKYFQSHEISDEVFARINGKSYVENNDIALSQLRYLTVLHYNFNHEIQSGELIVNAELADDFTNIFMELFGIGYEINSMRLIDDFWMGDGIASDTESIKHNNTSAFCYRKVFGGNDLSNHAKGCAIDINPMENPYVTYKNGVPDWYPEHSKEYIDRELGKPHVITNEDICYEIFTDYGFTWGGDWETPKDYQHFERAM